MSMTKSKSSDDRGKITAELPAVTLEEAPAVADALAGPGNSDVADIADEVEAGADDSRATRDLAPAFLEEFGDADASEATEASDEHATANAGDSFESETGPSAEMSAPVAATHADETDG